MPLKGYKLKDLKKLLMSKFSLTEHRREDVEDAFSNAMEQLVISKKENKEVKNLKGYVYKTMRYSLYNAHKRRQDERLAGNMHALKYLRPYDEINKPYDWLDAAVIDLLLGALLETLPPRQKTVLTLYCEGEKDTQTALKMGCKQDTVRGTRMKAIHALRSMVEGRDPDEILNR